MTAGAGAPLPRGTPLTGLFVPAAIGAALIAAAATGLPTVMYPSTLFVRMTPVRPMDYLFWVASALLLGLLLATYVPGTVRAAACLSAGAFGDRASRATAGGLLSVFAIACPVCNKLVVLALGAGGALTYFAPLQPVLGVASVGLLAYALAVRLHALGVGLPRPRLQRSAAAA